MKKTLIAAIFAIVSMASHAKDNSLADCSFGDLSGVTVSACSGFVGKNLISNSSDDQKSVLAILNDVFGLGVTSAGWIEKIDLGGSKTIDFFKPLSGTTIVGLHFGGGKYGPGNGTAFYQFDAGTNLNSFRTVFASSSSAALYLTSPVPEPENYAMLLAGLGVMGAIALRRKSAK